MNRDAIPLLYEKWTPELESELQVLKEKYIKIGDTAFARSVIVKKMELSNTADHYTREERNTLREKVALMDAAYLDTASVREALM